MRNCLCYSNFERKTSTIVLLHPVLIHAGGSGVGTAAVQLVALFGGRSFVTAGTQDKIDKVT